MEKMPKTIKYSLLLVVLGIVAGVLLAYVNSITAPIIAAREENELKEVLEGYFECERFTEETKRSKKSVENSVLKLILARRSRRWLSAKSKLLRLSRCYITVHGY